MRHLINIFTLLSVVICHIKKEEDFNAQPVVGGASRSLAANESLIERQAVPPVHVKTTKESLNLLNHVYSEFPLFLDLTVLVMKETITELMANKIDPKKFINDIFAEVSKVFALTNIMVSIRNIEFLKKEEVKSNIYETQGFIKYVTKKNFKDDATIVLRYTDDPIASISLKKPICSPEAVSIINTKDSLKDVGTISSSITHELGYALGFNDIERNSTCGCIYRNKQLCIMSNIIVTWSAKDVSSFESCNMNDLLTNLNSYSCLLKESKKPRLHSSCGDGVTDKNEQCDCGSENMCTILHDQTKCCNHTTCRLKKSEFQCSSGQCCRDCKFTKNVICRSGQSECDYSERCDGTNRDCPEDLVKADNKMCAYGQGICYEGMCTNLNSLCAYVYNNEEVYFSPDCVHKFLDIFNFSHSTYKNDAKYKNFLKLDPNPCSHFICAHKSGNIEGMLAFSFDDTICLIPDKKIKKGILKRAVDLMECGFPELKFCYEGKCIDGNRKLNNCENGACTRITGSNLVHMTRVFYHTTDEYGYKILNHSKVGTEDRKEPKTEKGCSLDIKFIVIFAGTVFLGFLITYVVFLFKWSSEAKKIILSSLAVASNHPSTTTTMDN